MGYKLTSCVLAVVLLSAMTNVYADPQIDPGGDSPPVGRFAEGDTVVITGIEFGSKDNAAPLVWDNFESGVHGQELGTPEVGPNHTFFAEGNPNPSYSTVQSHAGLFGALIRWTSYSISSFGWWPLPGAVKGSTYERIYLSFSRYMDPQEPSVLPGNHKILYFFGDYGTLSTPQVTTGAIMPTREHWSWCVKNEPTSYWNWSPGTPDTWAETINKWQRWELFVELENPYTAIDSGKMVAYIDGQLTLDRDDLNLTDVDGKIRGLRIGHMYGGYHPGGTDQCYFDNFYLDSTRARVEIGNASTWSACSHREIQIPTAWSPNSIEITVNQGSLPYGTAYLYVVAEDGSRNENGYEITVQRSPSWLTGVINRWHANKITADDRDRAVSWYMYGPNPPAGWEPDPIDIGNAIAIAGQE